MSKKTYKKIAITGAVAAAAGYIAGILTAPKSGKQTRKDIQQTAAQAKAEAEKQLKKLHSELDTHLSELKTATAKLSAKARAELIIATKKAKAAKEKARQVLTAVHEGTSEDKDLDKAVAEAHKALNHLKKFIKIK